MTLAEAAARRLAAGVRVDSLEQLWIDAALRALASGEPYDPDGAALRALTEPTQVWSDVLLADAERLQDRIGRLRDCHYLAIATEDTHWLTILARCWAHAPDVVGPWWPLRAHGEIALCTARYADTGIAWTSDEIEALLEESMLRLEAPADRAWLAIVKGEYSTARKALTQYEERLADAMHAWQQFPETGLHEALSYPGAALQTELRALQVVLRRSD